MAKPNTLEIYQYNHALKLLTNNLKTLYQELSAGILSVADIQEQVTMNKKQILELHKKSLTIGKAKTVNGTAIYQRKEWFHRKESRSKA